ncbi:MAG TPA: serine hydrolase [Chitinophagaceae bacterium]|nr:serine hydrolase [Chitinophagaceae bacterium]
MKRRYLSVLLPAIIALSCSAPKVAQGPSDFLPHLLANHPQQFDSILRRPQDYRVQIIYSRIDRKRSGRPVFTDYHYRVDRNEYFYPASTVKLPISLLALQRLNELNVRGLNGNTTMITGAEHPGQTAVYNDPTSPDGRPTVNHYIRKILLVSDNDASNRLYEFLGQEYVNHTLHAMGYDSVQILHRLDIFLTEQQNRQTNPVNFYDTAGKIIYKKPGETSALTYTPRNTKMGKGFMRGGRLVNESFDFSRRNRFPLEDLHEVLRSVIFPRSVPRTQQFKITEEDRKFLLKYMSMTPAESRFPEYDSTYQPHYVKFLYYGSERGHPRPGMRIFNKVGDAYGFLIDAAYFADFENKIEFLLSAVIYCNSDEIFNDNRYDYETVGFPFLKNLGRVIHEYELKRSRRFEPDLSEFRFDYHD